MMVVVVISPFYSVWSTKTPKPKMKKAKHIHPRSFSSKGDYRNYIPIIQRFYKTETYFATLHEMISAPENRNQPGPSLRISPRPYFPKRRCVAIGVEVGTEKGCLAPHSSWECEGMEREGVKGPGTTCCPRLMNTCPEEGILKI